MSKKKRAKRASSKRRPPKRKQKKWILWVVLAAVAVAGVVSHLATRSITPTNVNAGPLPGLQTGPSPWDPELSHLRARLKRIGFPTALTMEGDDLHIHEHLDVFDHGQKVEVPENIGISQQEGFLSPLHTHDATGIIHIESFEQRTFTLGEFFDVWGVRFSSTCIGGYCADGYNQLSVFVGGQHREGDPRSLGLAAHQQIVVAFGTDAELPNPIPASYTFPSGL
ncbi:MAG: hypothetical protein ACRDI1_12455 [Actinomycetota bacterium]